MIKSIDGDRYVQVVSGSPQYFSTTTSGSGMLRYNPTNYSVEVFNGNNWQILSHHATISLTPDATRVLEWGQRKMEQERKINEYADKYPAVAEALRHVQQSQEVLDSVVSLVKDY